MSDKLYTYAVARIRSKELELLDHQVLEQLLSCKKYEDCIRILREKGWGREEKESAEQILSVEREKIWEVIGQLVEDMSVFDTLLFENDFHNLKAAIKQVYTNSEFSNIYINKGTVSAKAIYQSVKEHDFSKLPDHMRECASEAFEVQLHTGDSQLSDVIVDKAALESIYKKGKESGIPLLEEYAELKVATANINIAIRSVKTGKSIEFLRRAFAKCDTLDEQKLITATLAGLEAIYEYLENTKYSNAIPAIKDSASAFERWCDDFIIDHIRPQKSNPFTIAPLAAYILARENEIKTVRILLSGKRNSLNEETIRERLREMYV